MTRSATETWTCCAFFAAVNPLLVNRIEYCFLALRSVKIPGTFSNKGG